MACQIDWALVHIVIILIIEFLFNFHKHKRKLYKNYVDISLSFFFFYLLASERDFKTMHEWRARQFFPKDEEKTRPRCVNQLTIGILGYGNMGKSIAKLFKVSLILYIAHHMSTVTIMCCNDELRSTVS